MGIVKRELWGKSRKWKMVNIKMLKLDIGFLSISLAIIMNSQDPQAPRKSKKNGVKNLNEHKLHLNFISKDERAWLFSFEEKRAKTVSEQIFHAGENPRVFGSTDLILA